MESLTIDTPVGPFTVTAAGGKIVGASFGAAAPDGAGEVEGVLARAGEELLEYFRGERRGFGVPLAPGGTHFELLVWQETARIPFGQTLTYGEVAARIGRASAARAVGNALGHNPLPIFIPCHRVVPRSGGLGGFGAGPEIKAALLRLESGGGPLRR